MRTNRETQNQPGSADTFHATGRHGTTLVELLVIVAIIAVLGSIVLPALSRSREASRRANCQSNLKQLALTLKMYAEESKGQYYPPTQKWHLNGTPTLSWIRGSALYPDYLQDLNTSVCPSDSRAKEFIGSLGLDFGAYLDSARSKGVSDLCWDALLSLGVSYTYTGYVTTSSSQLKDVIASRFLIAAEESINGKAAFVSAAKMQSQGCPRKLFVAYGNLGEQDIPGDPIFQAGAGKRDDDGAPLPNGYFRLRIGAERFLIQDLSNPGEQVSAASRIPLVLDTWAANVPLFGGSLRFNHIPGGSNVLYLDGHVDFVTLGSVSPVSDSPPETFGVDLSHMMALVSGSD